MQLKAIFDLRMMVAALGVVLMGPAAHATPVYFCKDGPGIDLVGEGCISGDARGYPGGGDGIYSNAGGGDPEAAVEAAILGAAGTVVDISLYGKTDDDPSLFSTTGFPGNSGTWSVLDGSLISFITVKASNSFALYDVGGVSSGTWSTAGILNNGGSQPGVSHISFWTTAADTTVVPLPAAGWMLLAGIGGLAAYGRRRRKAA